MLRRVALVTEFCPPYRTGFFNAIDDRFNATLLFTDTKESWRAFGDFDYRELYGARLQKRYRVSPGVFRHLADIDPEVVIGGPVEGFSGQSAYLYARATGTPFVLWTGEWHLPLTTLRTLSFPLIRRIYNGADAITVYGPHVRSYLEDLGVDMEKITVAWNTVDVDQFQPAPPERTEALREQHGIPREAPVVLYVGRLVREKGVDFLIEAFESIAAETSPDPHLLFVGDGVRRAVLESAAVEVPNVTFTGYVENSRLPRYYTLADVLVLPSIQTAEFREAWGLVVNEAMACGTPVVATGQVGAAAGGMVSDGVNGYVVPERNAAVLADRVTQVLSDSKLGTRLGRRARATVSEFDYERMVDGVEDAVELATTRRRV